MAELLGTSLFSDPNLLAYYTLEDANDDFASFNLTNTGTTPFVSAQYNNGADFGAINSGRRLAIANDLGLTGNAYTFAMWVNVNEAPSSGNEIQFVMHQGINGTDNEGIRYSNSGGTLRLSFVRVANGVSDETFNTNYTLTIGTWFHVAHTWNGTTMRGYVNGVEVGSRSSSVNGSSPITDDFSISRTGAQGGGFIGDDVAVFSRALDGAEINTLYTDTAVARKRLTLLGVS